MHDLSGGFTPDQMRRYSRQILLPDLGGRGQSRLLAATVAVSVDGAAGRIAGAYLAAAGVGRILLSGALDRPVTSSDFPLARPDLGQPLGPALAGRLAHLNPDAHVAVRDLADARTTDGNENVATLSIEGDADDLPLAAAMARGGEAAARMVWRLAVGTP